MAGSSRDSAPIDFDVLEDMRKYLRRGDRFREVEWRSGYAPDSLVCIYDPGYYPASVEDSSLEITWYKNDDFSIHYQENWATGEERKCRWDRHTNAHNTRNNVHPLLDVATSGTDRSFSGNWKDVVSGVLSEIDERIEAFWH